MDQVIEKDYQLIKDPPLGQGTYGIVVRAIEKATNRVCAIKLLKGEERV